LLQQQQQTAPQQQQQQPQVLPGQHLSRQRRLTPVSKVVLDNTALPSLLLGQLRLNLR
jgi:hypothetical protein